MGNLAEALRAEIAGNSAATPRLSAIRHQCAALLAMLEEERPFVRPGKVVTLVLTEEGRRKAGRTRLLQREELSGGNGLVVTRDGVDLYTDDPEVVGAVREYFDGEVVEVRGLPDPARPREDLVEAIRLAIREYDGTDDHCGHPAGADCVRCLAAAAAYPEGHPMRTAPPRRRRSA